MLRVCTQKYTQVMPHIREEFHSREKLRRGNCQRKRCMTDEGFGCFGSLQAVVFLLLLSFGYNCEVCAVGVTVFKSYRGVQGRTVVCGMI